MTPRERDMLAAIRRLTVDSVGPTVEEIGAEINLSKGGVYGRLERMRGKGLVAWTPRATRSIRVVADNDAYTPAALQALTPQALRSLIRVASEVLAAGGRE